MTRSSSTSAGFTNGSTSSEAKNNTSSGNGLHGLGNNVSFNNGDNNGHISNHVEAAEPPNTGLVKARTMSYQQNVIENGNNEDGGPRKTSLGGPRPNIKELTNKQRNWFSSFERSKTNEPIDSTRRTSVKNDNTPSMLSGSASTTSGPASTSSGPNVTSTPSASPKSSLSDATPTPPSNLDRPRDRRPLSARSSDSIEDYIRNWKKNGDDESSPEPTR